MLDHFSDLIARGFIVRPARIEDLPQAVPMFNAAERELTGGGDMTVERYTQEWLDTGIDLESSTRIVFSPEGDAAGCIEVWDHFNPPARPWLWGRVHPDWEGHGIGTALMEWAFDTTLRALDRLPDDARLAPHVVAPAHHQPSIDLFEGLGMQFVRVGRRMLRALEEPLPEPAWPEGIRVRPLHYPDDLEAAYHTQNEAFREHWGFVERPFEEGFADWRNITFEAEGLKPDLWFLAVDGEVIAGFINSQEHFDLDAGMGWIPTLCVRKEYRRRGLGQALLLHAFRNLQALGVKQVGLTVDSKNRTGATRLYERVGMHIDYEFLHYEIELRPGRDLAAAG
jgi:mycothiol synthase